MKSFYYYMQPAFLAISSILYKESEGECFRLPFAYIGLVLPEPFLLQEMIAHAGLPVKDVYEGLYFYAWVLVSLSLFINRIYKVDFLTFFLNVVGFFMMLLYIASSAYEREWTQTIPFMDEVLIAHVTLAIVAYGFFTLSFVFSGMYLLQFQLLKRKKGIDGGRGLATWAS